MKSLKKTLVLLVVFSMILSTLVPAFAATDVDGLECEDQVTRMEALGIIKGFEDGSFRPTETITRAQMAVIICKMTGVTDAIAEANRYVASKFSDVAAGEWYTGYVNIASNNGIITGFPDGTFRPNETLTLNQVLTLCVKALGRGGYVDKMGTWPANYIAEAARLNLLKDVKGASDANRGNVAVICWNTLNSKTWYVTGENLDGEVSLGQEGTKTLLSINFPDFVYEGKNEKTYLKEAEDLIVEEVPATDKSLENRQIVLSETAGSDGWNDFEDSFSKKSKDDTYINNAKTKVTATVPEEVWANLDELRGKKVTVLFGEDNIVALIVITNDDVIDGEFVEQYNEKTDEITIAGEDYEFAKDAKVFVNNVELTSEGTTTETGTTAGKVVAKEAMKNIVKEILKEEYEKDFNKKVAANVVLDEDGDIERLDLYVSGTYEEFKTIEAIVTDVDDDEFEFMYQAESGKEFETFDYSKFKKADMPTVTVDGKTASIEDIEEGNVILLSYAGKDSYSEKNVVSITVTTTVVEGEITKTKKAGNVVYVDGDAYSSSIVETLAYTDDEWKDTVYTGIAGTTVEKGDTVTLYVNAYGEIVLLATEDSTDGSDWKFAYVRSIKEVDENDDDEFYATLRLLLTDGSKTKDTSIVVATEDWKKEYTVEGKTLTGIKAFEHFADELVGKVIAYKSNSSNEIVLDSFEKLREDIIIVVDATGAKFDALVADVDGDFDVKGITNRTVNTDYKEVAGEYDWKSNSVIIDLKEEAVYTKWSSMIANKQLVGDAIVICEDGKTDIKYIIFKDTKNSSSDSIYAIFKEADADEAKLENGEEITLAHKDEDLFDDVEEDAFVEYSTNSKNEIDAIKMLIDVKKFTDNGNRDKEIAANVLANGDETTLVFANKNIGVTGIKSKDVTDGKVIDQYAHVSFGFDLKDGLDGNKYYVYETDKIFDVSKPYTLVYDNPAMKDIDTEVANPDKFVGKVKFSETSGKDYFAFLLKDGTSAKFEIYEGDLTANDAYKKATPIMVYEFNNIKLEETSDTTPVIEGSVAVEGLTPAHFKIDSVDGYKLTYVDNVKNSEISLETIKVDIEGTTVYDLTKGFSEAKFDSSYDFAGRYVIPFKTSECDGGADANILVIVK